MEKTQKEKYAQEVQEIEKFLIKKGFELDRITTLLIYGPENAIVYHKNVGKTCRFFLSCCINTKFDENEEHHCPKVEIGFKENNINIMKELNETFYGLNELKAFFI